MIRRIAKLALVLVTATALMSGAALASSDGDAAKGKRVFNKCKACHSLDPSKKKPGPTLKGIIGRAAGSADGFKYTKAMKGSGLTWDEETLKMFLTKPKKFVPGTKMSFAGLRKEKQRDDLIAYLRENAM